MFFYCSLWINALLLYIIVILNSSDANSKRLVAFQRITIAVLIALLFLLATNSYYHLIIKPFDSHSLGFTLGTNSGPLGTALSVISMTSVLFVFCCLFILKKKNRLLPFRILLRLFATSTILPLISVLDLVFPLLAPLHAGSFLMWVPASMICVLLFCHIESSRNIAIDTMNDTYVVFDLRGYCVDINAAGMQFFDQLLHVERPRLQQLMSELQIDTLADFSEREITILNKNSQPAYYHINTIPLNNSSEQNSAGFIIREITKYRKTIDKLSLDVEEDPLTGLKNRRCLLEGGPEVLSQMRRQHEPLAVMMIDIDCFKEINDNYGHLTGDDVLVALTNLLTKSARVNDTVFRYGGDEFLILCHNTAEHDAGAIAERIRKEVEQTPFRTESGDIHVTVSIGLYSAVPHPEDTIESFTRGRQPAYKAKSTGRNCVVAQNNN